MNRTSQGGTASRAPAIGFVLVTLTLATMGMGLLIPVLPKLVVQLQGGDLAEGAHAYGWLVSAYALMQFVGSPLLGALSDRFGRRRIILIATAGSAVDYVMMALAPTLGWLFLARIIAGFTAGVMATANAYVVDLTPPERRAGAFGLLGGAFGVGFVLGPALGGLLGGIDLRLPFWVAAGCAAANGLFGWFVLPESLPTERRRPFSWARANPVGSLLALRRFPAVLGLAEAYFLMNCTYMMLFSTWALYTAHRYQWDPQWVGLSLMASGVLSGVVQATLVRRIVPALGASRAVLLGMGLSVCVHVGYGLATTGGMLFAVMAIGSLAGIAGPALQSYTTPRVPPDEQGAVQGIYAGLASLAGIPAPFVATWLFGWGIDPARATPVPGLSFFAGALVMLVALGLAARSFRRDARPSG